MKSLISFIYLTEQIFHKTRSSQNMFISDANMKKTTLTKRDSTMFDINLKYIFVHLLKFVLIQMKDFT